MKTRKSFGFTLLELIIVLAILAIIASVAVARFVDISKKATIVKEDATIASLKTAALLFKAYNNYWPAENGVDPINNRDIFALLENPPPYNFGMFVGDGRNWAVIPYPHGLFYEILCPHHTQLGSTGPGRKWRYIRSPIAGDVAQITLIHDGGH